MSDVDFKDEINSSIGQILKRLAAAGKETRARIQAYGVDVIPINFYSNTPSIAEIESSFEYASDQPPYLDTGVFEPETLLQTLRQLLEFSPEFNPPLNGNADEPSGFFWSNTVFSYSDAMSYYCFVRQIKPASIVEIGSGFSTLVAIQAGEKNRLGKIHCIEPYPRRFLSKEKRIDLHTLKAQEISPEYLNEILRDNDILLIDSKHTV